MAEHNDIGKKGEEIAAEYLSRKGYTVLETNWRFKHLEADLIATHKNTLVIAEVKTRRTNFFGEPETFVNKQKQKNLRQAANEYIERYNIQFDTRFDIISVLISDTEVKVNHIEDAFLF
jgi:putative endonuclease